MDQTQQKQDALFWTDVIKNVTPLEGKEKLAPPSFPKRLTVISKETTELKKELDLHGLTIQEAYETTKRFLLIHQKRGSLKVHVITGKGLNSHGLIKREIEFWLETPDFRSVISSYKWENGGGSLLIMLKRIKK